MNRSAARTDEGETAPTLASGADVPNVGGLDTGLDATRGPAWPRQRACLGRQTEALPRVRQAAKALCLSA